MSIRRGLLVLPIDNRPTFNDHTDALITNDDQLVVYRIFRAEQ